MSSTTPPPSCDLDPDPDLDRARSVRALASASHPRSTPSASSSLSSGSPSRAPRRELAVTTQQPQPLHNSSHALLSSLAANPAAYAPDGTKKLTKWLTRSRAKSVTTANALADSSSSPGATLQPTMPGGPLISLSPSSSAGSDLSGKENPLSSPAGHRPEPNRSRSSTSSQLSGSGFAGLSLRSSRKGRGPGDESLEEWATPDVVDREDDLMDRETNGRGAAKPPAGRGALFSLKRTKSHLRLFGAKPADTADSPYDQVAPPDLRTSTSSFQLARTPSISQPVAASVPNSQSFTYGQGSPGGANGQGNVAGRLGGWFSSMLHSGSSSHLPLPAETSPSPSVLRSPSAPHTTPVSTTRHTSSSPKKGPQQSGGTRLGPLDRMLDKAVQYFLDTDSQADKCEADIWVLGVRHQGYAPPLADAGADDGAVEVLSSASGSNGDRDERQRKRKSVQSVLTRGKKGKDRKRASVDVDSPPNGAQRHSSTPPTAHRTASSDDQYDARSISSSPPSSVSLSPQPSFQGLPSPAPSAPSFVHPPNPGAAALAQAQTFGWPAEFYHDFYSRVGLTYRTGFPPIPCAPAHAGGVHSVFNSLSMSIGRGGPRTSDGLSSDTGWGCMLRTGQSLLANTLVTVHLGRDWRRPLPPPTTPSPQQQTTPTSAHTPVPPVPELAPSHADYARILSLFVDDPSPLAPFSVHRFALMGKQLGKEVGEWFGPSTAAGAIKALVTAFEPAGLAVCSVVDGTVYKTDVEVAAMGSDGEPWAKPVLVLIGLRLGIDGVNPIYHEAVKGIFSFPQSVGIAGGRPSSSYYFVGAQANSLFYIDPHHPRPSIALRNPPPDLVGPAQSLPLSTSLSTFPARGHAVSESFVTVVPSPPATPMQAPLPADRLADFFADAYPDHALRTYHTDKVRKMALSSLDPSMLVGFLVRDEDDWDDFSSRVRLLSQEHTPIFSLADKPPAWMRRSTGSGAHSSTSESDGGVGSFSEPDDWELDSAHASSPAQRPVDDPDDEEDDDWENSNLRDDSPSPLPIDLTWQTIPPPESPSSRTDDDSVVVVVRSPSTPARPVEVPNSIRMVSPEKPALEEDWEGVAPSAEDESDDLAAESYRLAPSSAASSRSESPKLS